MNTQMQLKGLFGFVAMCLALIGASQLRKMHLTAQETRKRVQANAVEIVADDRARTQALIDRLDAEREDREQRVTKD